MRFVGKGSARPVSMVPAIVALAILVVGTVAHAHAARPIKIRDAVEQVREVEKVIVAMEQASSPEPVVTDQELARRLVKGQLMLAESDFERAAVLFLDLLENYPSRPAGRQAMYFMGEALARLGMPRWAAECFTNNLADTTRDGKRYQQRSLAQLFYLALPSQGHGFARQPGISATPEFRARLQAIGVATEVESPRGVFAETDLGRLTGWVRSIAIEQRSAELQYSFGRYIFLTKDYEAARDELDAMWPPEGDPPEDEGLVEFAVRAHYVAAAAVLGMGETEGALERFHRVARTKARTGGDKQIVTLAWMALGRIYHDQRDADRAVAAYRQIPRASPLFAEALYETAWTQLRGGAFEPALQTLEVLLIHAPDSPVVPEVKQLRGKLRIQQRDWKGAEVEFIALRRDFAKLSDQLGRQLEKEGEAGKLFTSIAAEEAENFSLASVMPPAAVSIARRLPRAVQSEALAREIGWVRRELDEAQALLGRMEQAVGAPQRARLFTKLGNHLAALDAAALDLVELQEDLISRAKAKGRRNRVPAELESLRKRYREALGHPTVANATREQVVERLEELAESIHRYDLMVTSLRAQLVASEQYYEQTVKQQRLSAEGFLNQATELRELVADLSRRVLAARTEAEGLRTALRFSDPWSQARIRLIVQYRQLLGQIYAGLAQHANDRDAVLVWVKVEALHGRIAAGYQRLDVAAGRRLKAAIAILAEERQILAALLAEYDPLAGDGRQLVGEALEASYRDVVGEATNMVTRSEVGLLDVAWAIQQVEAEEIRRLEANRARDLAELERVMEQGLEELK